jgi:hypothetical protein
VGPLIITKYYIIEFDKRKKKTAAAQRQTTSSIYMIDELLNSAI